MYCLGRKRKATDNEETVDEAVETPKKRTRKASGTSAKKPKSAKRSARKKQEDEEAVDDEEEDEKMEVDQNGDETGGTLNQLFENCYFMLTSSARRTDGNFFMAY